MRILLCNERLLFRFGVDRVLVKLGAGLRAKGHHVSVLANRSDPEVVRSFASESLQAPAFEGQFLQQNELTAQWLEREWDSLFPSGRPDVVLVAGWPFFAAMTVFRARGCAVVFLDAGAVPLDGFEGGALINQQKVRQMRRLHVGDADLVIGISEFITRTQSGPDAGGRAKLATLLLGVSHIEEHTWKTGQVGDTSRSEDVERIERLIASGWRIVANLGRWEPGTYKNSEAVFPLARALKEAHPKTAILVLEEPSALEVPEDLRENVLAIGFPSDEVLKQLTQLAHLGVSVSRWEGFNLPLGEMQWLGKPVLVFDAGAHPEVVLDRWFLCADAEEMTAKARSLLAGGDAGPDLPPARLEEVRAAWKARFHWSAVVDGYENALVAAALARRSRPRVLIDVTNAAVDPANSGVIRVTRLVCRHLQELLDPLFVLWDASISAYVWPTEREYAQLGQYNGPRFREGMPRSPADRRRKLVDELPDLGRQPTVLFVTETLLESNGARIRAFARANGIRLAAIFYDAIPVLHPELVKDTIIRDNHADYMAGLAGFDVVFPISRFSGRCLEEFWGQRGLERHGRVEPLLLAADFDHAGVGDSTAGEGPPVRMLCVSTLEPRKNHQRLLEACELLQAAEPSLDWELRLVGNRYAGAPELPRLVEDASRRNPKIRWLGIVPDAELRAHYQAAHFTIYPSVVEGYGLPIVESVAYGKPCITSKDGVMGELAAGGGCLTVDVTSVPAIADALRALATDAGLRRRLRLEALARPASTWKNYAAQLAWRLAALFDGGAGRGAGAAGGLLEFLFPGRDQPIRSLAPLDALLLTGLLARISPVTSLVVANPGEGVVELAAKFSDLVWCLGAGADEAPEPGQANVRLLRGDLAETLPMALIDGEASRRPLDLVYHDGRGSPQELRLFWRCLRSYRPCSSVIVVMRLPRSSTGPGSPPEASEEDSGSRAAWAAPELLAGADGAVFAVTRLDPAMPAPVGLRR